MPLWLIKEKDIAHHRNTGSTEKNKSMKTQDKILITGASGLVGSAIVRDLLGKGYTNLIGTYQSRKIDLDIPMYQTDFRDQEAVAELFEKTKPDYVFLAAARVGGIMANNTYRADFIHDNLLIHINIIHQSYLSKVKKLLYLGSTCIYPRDCPQPMKEDHLLTSPLEYTNEPYAIAKIAGLKMCESFNLQYGTNYISVMPTNLYGPGDNFDLEKAHVLPSMMRKIHLGKCLEENNWDAIRADLNTRPVNGVDGSASDEAILNVLEQHGVVLSSNASRLTPHASRPCVEIWGTGKPKREFLWSEDMADACIFVMENIDFPDLTQDKKEVRNTHINIGSGGEISIGDLARAVQKVVGFTGDLVFNTDKPDGTPRKLTDVSRLHSLGWKHRTELDAGLDKFYKWYLNNG